MDPLSAGIIGGATILTGLMGSNSSGSALKWNKKAQKITWEREDNAVQRRAADLKAAGYSPLLAAGASAQTSPAAHIGAQEVPDLGSAMSSGLDAGMHYKKQQADVSQTDAQTKLIKTQQEGAEKQNKLTQMQINWYENHPNAAPGVPGMATPNMLERGLDMLVNYAGRAGDYVKNNFGSSQKGKRSWFLR